MMIAITAISVVPTVVAAIVAMARAGITIPAVTVVPSVVAAVAVPRISIAISMAATIAAELAATMAPKLTMTRADNSPPMPNL